MRIKKFFDWINLKEKIDSMGHKAPHVSEGEIWWTSMGENVGSEINGKSRFFSRPAIIFKKLSHDFYYVIPITTQIRKGSWYINFKQKGREMTACLHQARPIDYRRLYSRLGRLDDSDYEGIKAGFKKLYL